MPLANAPKDTPIPEDIVNSKETTDKGPVNVQQIKERTGRDPVMAEVGHCILMGTGLVHKMQSSCHSLVERMC